MATDTLVHRIAGYAESKANDVALRDKSSGSWASITWSDYWTAIREVAKGLIALGHQPGECVAIVGDNRADWVFCQFGIMAVRGIPAPIYQTNTPAQAAYIVRHSRAKIAICDKREQLAKFHGSLEAGEIEVEHIVTMDDLEGDRVTTLAQLRKLGREQDDAELDARLDALTQTETALLIYTSGTTGVPKAVQLDHGGMISMSAAIMERFDALFNTGDYRVVSYLPLCHVAEQVFTNMLHLQTGGEVNFCPDLKQLKDYLLEVKPTMLLGVPRVWEKFQAKMEVGFADAPWIRQKLLGWARGVEMAAFDQEAKTGRPVESLSRTLANKIVLSKVKAKLGLEELGAAATGAAPIGLETLRFFASLGVTIYEGYGMSETTGVATCATFGAPRFGTVGQALSGVEVKIAEDGEILLKGRIMTRGYLHDEAKSDELYGGDQGAKWLHTGDIGELDGEGYLRITGRKKDLLITAGGKNVAPAEMEAHLKGIAGVGHAVVVGDRQPYLCALLVIDPEQKADLEAASGISGSIAELAASDALNEWLMTQVEVQCNAKVARYQTIKKVAVLPSAFSVETGEVTPTLKIKRNVVNDKFADAITTMYDG
jgi:long-subunit acyl-CoA synthetase (AMP-forming)